MSLDTSASFPRTAPPGSSHIVYTRKSASRLALFNMGESGKLMKNFLNNIDVFNGHKYRFTDWVIKSSICFEHSLLSLDCRKNQRESRAA